MTAAAHPAWCHIALCDAAAAGPDLPPAVGGAHRSHQVQLSLPVLLDDPVAVVAQLRAPLGSWQTDAVLALTIGAAPTLLLRLDALPAAVAGLLPLLASADVEV